MEEGDGLPEGADEVEVFEGDVAEEDPTQAAPKRKRRKAGEKWRQANEGKDMARPVRETCKIARDHIYANLLQQQFSFRAYGAMPAAGSKARKATKAASAAKNGAKKEKEKSPQNSEVDPAGTKKRLGVAKKKQISKKKGKKGKGQKDKANKTGPKELAASKKKSPNSKPSVDRELELNIKAQAKATLAARKFADNNSKPRSPGKSKPSASPIGKSTQSLEGQKQSSSAKSRLSVKSGERVLSKSGHSDANKADRQVDDHEISTANRSDDTEQMGANPGRGFENYQGVIKQESDQDPNSTKKTELQRFKMRLKRKREMMIESIVSRTKAVASTGIKGDDWEEKKSVHVAFTLCPAEDPHPHATETYMGKLTRSKLTAPAEATVLHLKKFLQNKLSFDGPTSQVEIACRGFALADEQTLFAVKNLLWPPNHHLDPILRFRKIVANRAVPVEAQSIQAGLDLAAMDYQEKLRRANANPNSNFHRRLKPINIGRKSPKQEGSEMSELASGFVEPKLDRGVREEHGPLDLSLATSQPKAAGSAGPLAPKPHIPPDEEKTAAEPPVGPNHFPVDRELHQIPRP